MTEKDTTELLRRWSAGDETVLSELSEAIYRELCSIAGRLMLRERRDHTLQPTALAHEAFIKLIGHERVEWQNRAHFFAIASRVMRRFLVDHARRVQAEKRGGKQQDIPLSTVVVADQEKVTEVVALNEALRKLEEMDERGARIVELRYFGGLSVDETSHVLGISPATVKRGWASAKAWLRRELQVA